MLVTVRKGNAKERKVKIIWVDKAGKTQHTVRWLSQVETYVRLRVAHGDPGPFQWRLHDRAPWHTVEVTQ